jgi:transposase-like protein
MDREELKRLTKEEISRRIREGVKAVIEQVLEEEMTEHLAAGYRERTPSRAGSGTATTPGTSSRQRAGSPSSGYPGTGRGLS